MFLVVGLGNPGREYAAHRHNVGFMAVEELARRARADAFREKFSGEWTKGEIAGEPAVFLKPMTYMNESGRSVQPAMAFFKVLSADVLVVHDELDLPFGDVRLKMGGGHAGHNGLRSIMASAGGEFGRVRIGVGRPPAGFKGDVADFVLSGFTSGERAALPELLKKAADAVVDVAETGFAKAMNARNTRPKTSKPKIVDPALEEAPAPAEACPGCGAALGWVQKTDLRRVAFDWRRRNPPRTYELRCRDCQQLAIVYEARTGGLSFVTDQAAALRHVRERSRSEQDRD